MSNDPQHDTEQRDKVLARLAADALRSDAVGGASHSCPDAETLAAYADRSLDPEEAARWENHFADCARCRKILAALVVSADEPLLQQEVQKLGESAAPVAEPVAVPRPPAAPSLAATPRSGSAPNRTVVMAKRGNARWVVPAIAAAAAALLWFVLRPAPPPSTQFVAQNTPADNSAPPNVPPVDSGTANSPLPDSSLPNSTVPGSSAAQGQIPSPPASGFAPPGAAGSPAAQAPFGQGPAAASTFGAARQQPQAYATSPSPAAATPPTAPPPASRDALDSAQANAPALKAPVSTQQPLVTITTEIPQLETEKTEPSTGVLSGAPAGLLGNAALLEQSKGVRVAGPLAPAPEKKVAPLFTIVSPGGAQWRGGTAGLIEHSVNQGRDWQTQPSGVKLDLAAGSASSDQVAWIVGHAGVILRTTDGGMSWQRITSPNATITDWTAVQASDAQRATITAKDQHRFTTTDGGQNWNAQP